ncbi:MAG TPA: hypothetical protein DCY59_12040 [Micrococcaceae bacterium]|nr:hypothetical protein [Micrococcaceae bacterium]
MSEKPEVYGVEVDAQTRCAHYHQLIDVIAIKHYCCGKYYPCHLCHEETAGHRAILWPAERIADPAVLCGVCSLQLSVNEYLKTNTCPRCDALFNPGCKLHRQLYFED